MSKPGDIEFGEDELDELGAGIAGSPASPSGASATPVPKRTSLTLRMPELTANDRLVESAFEDSAIPPPPSGPPHSGPAPSASPPTTADDSLPIDIELPPLETSPNAAVPIADADGVITAPLPATDTQPLPLLAVPTQVSPPPRPSEPPPRPEDSSPEIPISVPDLELMDSPSEQLAAELEDPLGNSLEEETSDRRATPPAAPSLAPPSTAPATAAGRAVPPPVSSDTSGKLRRRRRSKQWFEEVFDEDYLRTLPHLTADQTEREVDHIVDALGVKTSCSLLDLGCGYGRHAMILAARGHRITGVDLSLPLLIRAADAARRSSVQVNFVHGDMRELSFDAEFDAAYCYFSSFGFFDDDTNRKVVSLVGKALKPGGRFLLDVVNRDFLIRRLPERVWWQGQGCVVLEEADFNYFTSRLQVQRSIVFEDGRQSEQELSIRAYSLHEIGKLLHRAGFRVIEISGGLAMRGRFFGNECRQILVVAEKHTDVDS